MAGVFRARSLKLNPETVVLVPALRPIPQNMSGQVGSDVRHLTLTLFDQVSRRDIDYQRQSDFV